MCGNWLVRTRQTSEDYTDLATEEVMARTAFELKKRTEYRTRMVLINDMKAKDKERRLMQKEAWS
jgi:hypothetical protein